MSHFPKINENARMSPPSWAAAYTIDTISAEAQERREASSRAAGIKWGLIAGTILGLINIFFC